MRSVFATLLRHLKELLIFLLPSHELRMKCLKLYEM